MAVTELCEYAANVDVAIACESIRAVGKIVLQQYMWMLLLTDYSNCWRWKKTMLLLKLW